MLKREEEENLDSCFNKADDDEFIFVLLAMDKAFAETVRFWAKERVRLGPNTLADKKIITALLEANAVEERQKK